MTGAPLVGASTVGEYKYGSGYLLGHSDVGHRFKAMVTVYGPGGYGSAWTPLSAVVASLPPSSLVAPKAAGTPQEGNTLVAHVGAWDGTPASNYTHQWRRCDAAGAACADIVGATGSSYVLTSADVGATIRVRVTAINSAGSAAATSEQTPAIQPVPKAPVKTSAPQVSGTARSGETLTTTNGGWANEPLAYAYQWQRCDSAGGNCVDVPGAVDRSYKLSHGEVGFTVRSLVTALNPAGAGQAASVVTSRVEAQAPVKLLEPAATGAPVVGATMTATPGGWDGTPTISYAYQWRRCDGAGSACADIGGADRQSYEVAMADAGSTLRVRVSATNQAGTVDATSQQSVIVQGSPLAPCPSGQVGSGQVCATPPPPPGACPTGQVGIQPACVTPPLPPGSCPPGQVGVPPQCTTPPPPPEECPPGQVGAQPACVSQPSGSGPPRNQVAPVIVGAAREGQNLTAQVGRWEGAAPIAYDYQWRRCDTSGTNCGDIERATDQVHRVTHADIGAAIRVRVAASNDSGSASETSAPTTAVDPRFGSGGGIAGPGPVDDPVFGGQLDPFNSGLFEGMPAVTQPDATKPPVWSGLFGAGYFDAPSGTFNAQLNQPNPEETRFDHVTTGTATNASDYVYVGGAAGIVMYRADTLAYVRTFGPASYPRIAYYRGEVYAYTSEGSSAGRFDVYDSATGEHKRAMPVRLPRQIPGANSSNDYSSIGLAWREIWATRDACPEAAARIDVFESQTGAYKGSTFAPVNVANTATRIANGADPAGAATDPFNCAGGNRWWDVSLAPDLDAAIANYRVTNRSPLLAALAAPDASAALPHFPTYISSGGTDEVWGMNWLLTAPVVPDPNSSTHPRYGPNIEELALERDPLTGFVTAAPQRTWAPKQSNGITDLAYRYHEAEIVATGRPLTDEWQNGQQCISYIVTDADFYLLGRRGERWYEQARGFQDMKIKIDDTTVATSTNAYEPQPGVCFDTNQFSSGTHTLTMTARVNDTTITKTNNNLRIDHDNPTGALDELPSFVRGTGTVTGTVTDIHAGPGDWQVQVSPHGANSWSDASGCSLQSSSDVTNKYKCSWDTTSISDGEYDLRTRLRDRVAAAAPNTGYSPTVSTTVDNTNPVIDNMRPDLYEDGYTAITEIETTVGWTHGDQTSGVRETTVEVNSASDGSDKGSWQPIGSSSSPGETEAPWNTTTIDGGLYRFRARSCDNAGNCAERQWQGLVPPHAARSKPGTSGFCKTSGFVRCYAGKFAGAYPHVSYGTEATLTTPALIRPQQDEETYGYFSSAWTGVGGLAFTPRINLVFAGSLQGGTTTEQYCGKNPISTGDGLRDRWFRYVEYVFPDETNYTTCYGPTGVGDSDTYKVDILATDRHRARGYINGVQKFVDLFNHPAANARYRRRGYYLTKYGNRNTQATGEVSTRFRQMGGRFSGWSTQRTLRGSWGPPSSAAETADPGYVIRSSSLTRFCVGDKARGCAIP